MQVELTYLIKEKILKDRLEKAVKKISRFLKIKKDLSLVVVGKEKIKKINCHYRHKNKVTDVLSFEGEDNFLGEIFLCLPIARQQAKKFGLTLEEELIRLTIHGILHLQGLDHEKSEKEAKKMFTLQDKILRMFTKKYVSTT